MTIDDRLLAKTMPSPIWPAARHVPRFQRMAALSPARRAFAGRNIIDDDWPPPHAPRQRAMNGRIHKLHEVLLDCSA